MIPTLTSLAEFRELRSIFAAEHLAPGALDRAHEVDYPRDVARLMARQGLLGLSIPEKLGGQGAGLTAAVTAIQAVAATARAALTSSRPATSGPSAPSPSSPPTRNASVTSPACSPATC